MQYFTLLRLIALLVCGALLTACSNDDAVPAVTLRYSGVHIDNLAPFVLAYSSNTASGQHDPIFVASDATSSSKTASVTPVKDQVLEVVAELRGVSGTSPVPAAGHLNVEVLVGGQVLRTVQVDAGTPAQPNGYRQAATRIDYAELSR